MKTRLCIMVLFICTITNAINLSQNPFEKDYTYCSFKNINLPFDANIINTIYQDENGIMWIGSKKDCFSIMDMISFITLMRLILQQMQLLQFISSIQNIYVLGRTMVLCGSILMIRPM